MRKMTLGCVQSICDAILRDTVKTKYSDTWEWGTAFDRMKPNKPHEADRPDRGYNTSPPPPHHFAKNLRLQCGDGAGSGVGVTRYTPAESQNTDGMAIIRDRKIKKPAANLHEGPAGTERRTGRGKHPFSLVNGEFKGSYTTPDPWCQPAPLVSCHMTFWQRKLLTIKKQPLCIVLLRKHPVTSLMTFRLLETEFWVPSASQVYPSGMPCKVGC